MHIHVLGQKSFQYHKRLVRKTILKSGHLELRLIVMECELTPLFETLNPSLKN